MNPLRRARRRAGTLALAMAVTAGSLLAAGPIDAVDAQANPYQRGPAPTLAALDANLGPFQTATSAPVPAGNGFGGGVIYYPTDTSQGTFGAVAVAPGWTELGANVNWLGPRLASHGFVVFVIDVNNTWFDLPDARGTQLQAALNWLSTSSPVASRIDRTRLAVMGHSMGGGGTLTAARANANLQAAIPLAPWHTNTNNATLRVPTLIIGAAQDNIAPVASHSEPMYTTIPNTTDKAYYEVANAGHFVTNNPGTPVIGRMSVAWLKRFVDNDTRYDQFLCPGPTGATVSEYRNNCPLGDGTGGPGPTPEPECEWWDFLCWLGG